MKELHLTIATLLLSVLMVSSALGAQSAPQWPRGDGEATLLGTSELPSPVWMAIISDAAGHQFLARSGEPIFSDGSAHPIGVVRSVGRQGMTLALTRGGRLVSLTPGRSIPADGGLAFHQAVRVKTLEYRKRIVPAGSKKILDGDLYLVGLRGTWVTLQRDADPVPSPTASLEQRLESIHIAETSPNTWEVSAMDLQVAMESGEAIAARALRDSRIDISRDRGVSLEFKTPLVDVQVDSRGFLVTNPNLARRAGLQVGDRILDVNGMAIDGFGGLFRAYQRIRRDSSIRTVTLTIERNQKPLTLTYRVR